MNQIKAILFLLPILLLLSECTVKSQAETKILSGDKTIYAQGDKIEMVIYIHTLPETCADGMEKTRLFKRGIDFEKESEWEMIRKGLWQKKVCIVLTGNKSGVCMLTIFRRTDKESISQQVVFRIKP